MKTKPTTVNRLVVKPIVRKPRIAVIQGEVSTTSMALAEHFGKRHDNVLQYIEAQIAEMPTAFRKLNFQVTLRNVNGPNGAVRNEKYIRMSRDGFVLIAMGFGGKEAMKWKVAYIEAFNSMERELLGRKQKELLSRPGAPIREDGLDSPLFNELFRALNKKVGQAMLLTYLIEAGAHQKPYLRTSRGIAADLQHMLCRTAIVVNAAKLEDQGLIEYGDSVYSVTLDRVSQLLKRSLLDDSVLFASETTRLVH